MQSSLFMMSALELSQAIRGKAASCLEVMQAHLDQVDRLNRASLRSFRCSIAMSFSTKRAAPTPSWRRELSAARCTDFRMR